MSDLVRASLPRCRSLVATARCCGGLPMALADRVGIDRAAAATGNPNPNAVLLFGRRRSPVIC